MKLVDYQLQTKMEYLSPDKPMQFFKEYITGILEDQSKPYHVKADYIGLSLNELKTKIDSVSHSIKELQEFKKKLTTSLDLAKEITAEVLVKNDIDRVDGNIISSLTLTKATTRTKSQIEILDKNKVMELGFVKYEPDIDAIRSVVESKKGLEELQEFISVTIDKVDTPAKVKVNNKRNKDLLEVDEILTEDENSLENINKQHLIKA
jgi:hypothetical protein